MESNGEKANGLEGFKPKYGRFRFNGATMAGPPNQNPKGRRLIPMLLKQGLMLLPLSLNILGKMASF